MKHILLVLVLGAFPSLILACSCAGPNYFCSGVVEDRPVVLVRVGEEVAPGFFKFYILDNLINELEEDVIVLQAQTGWNCLAPLYQFEKGDSMVFNLELTSSSQMYDTLDYALTFCGTQYLKIQNGLVLGKIVEGTEEVSYSEFKSLIGDCGQSKETPTTILLPKLTPNPVENIFTLESEEEILDVQLFDLSGRPFSVDLLTRSENNMLINVAELPGGIYLLKIHGSNSEEYIKLVKR